MAPYTKNMGEVQLIRSSPNDTSRGTEEMFSFEARIDEDWLVFVVPNGGYLLGLVLQACEHVQKSTSLQDPLYLSSQFLGASTPGTCTIIVRRIKSGKSYTNLTAELVQNGRINIHCQLIYGILEIAKHPYGPFPTSPSILTHAHPSALSRRCPLSTHPSKCPPMPFTRPYTFAKHMTQSVDLFYADQIDKLAEGEEVGVNSDFGGGGFVWAGWLEMVGEGEKITSQMLPLFADVTPDLIPQSMVKKREPMWFPTLALSVDFKHRVPSLSNPPPGIAPRTVGVFVRTNFLIEGRHELTAEIWTAPSAIGQGEEEEGWRDKMFCLAVATQSAMTVSGSVNEAKGKGKSKL